PPIAAIPPPPGMKEDEEEEEEAVILDDEVIEEPEPAAEPGKDKKVEAEALDDAMASIAKASKSLTPTMPLIPGGERRIPSPSPIPPVPLPSAKAGRPSAPLVPGISGSRPQSPLSPFPSVPPEQAEQAMPSIPPVEVDMDDMEQVDDVAQKDSAPPLSALSRPECPPPGTPPLAGSAPAAPLALAETMLAAPGRQAGPEAPPREKLPSAQEILPPHTELEAVFAAQQQEKAQVQEPAAAPKKRGRMLGIIFIGLGFIIVAAVVLVVLVALGVRIPVGERYQHQLRNLLGGTTDRETIAKGGDTSGPADEEGEGSEEATPSEGEGEEASGEAEEEGESDEGGAEGEEETQEGEEEEGESEEGEEGEEGEGEREQEAAAPPITMADVEGKTPQKLSFSISASSQHRKYPAANMIDGDPTTVWQEDKKLKPIGHTLTITFEKEVIVTAIKVLGGYDDPKGDKGDMWPIHTRLQKVNVEFEGGSSAELELDDARELQTRTFEAPRKTRKMTITVTGVYKGSWFNDNAVAELEVWGFSN
ncbi:MAG: discoidin domain-containing protein, partial [Pseudomonadota bacterium]